MRLNDIASSHLSMAGFGFAWTESLVNCDSTLEAVAGIHAIPELTEQCGGYEWCVLA